MFEFTPGILEVDWPGHSSDLARWEFHKIVGIADPENRATMYAFNPAVTGRRGNLVAVVLDAPETLTDQEVKIRAGAKIQTPGTKLTLGTGTAFTREHYRHGSPSGPRTAIGVDSGLDAATVRAVLWHHVRLEFHG